MSGGKEEGTVGERLRKRRMLRGVSLESAHQHTRIPKKLLEALEADDRNAFPARVYLRGFLKNYCDFLDMDFESLWLELEPARKAGPGAEADRRLPETPPARRLKGGKPSDLSALPIVLGAVVAAAGVAAWLATRPAPRAGGPAASGPRGSAATARPEKRTGEPQAAEGGKTLTLEALEDTALRLRVDGTLRFEGRLPAGTRQSWTARDGFELRAAPETVAAWLDGEPLRLDALPAGEEGWRTVTGPTEGRRQPAPRAPAEPARRGGETPPASTE